MKIFKTTIWTAVGLFGLAALVAMPAAADFVIADDLIVDGSACIGFDCVNGESFGFDTIRIKENNLRIKAQDTSSTASFPTQDWQLTFNDSTNGGLNKFSVDCIAPGSSTPLTVEGCAPSHSLYVDDGGRIGFGTNAPVSDLHVVSGNTPTLRLQQDGSSGFTPQTWDVAGNEAGFFIRDATNGSTLPFRIRPGAPSSAIDIAGDGDVGIGTGSPDSALHVRRTSSQAQIHVDDEDDTEAARVLIEDSGTGSANRPGFSLKSPTTAGGDWDFLIDGAGDFIIDYTGTAGPEMRIQDTTGEVFFSGDVSITGQCTEVDGACAPDYVFEPDYTLRGLDELATFVAENKHLPNVPSAKQIEANGINMRRFNFALLEKIEELVLYTLQQQETIDALTARFEALESKPE